VAIRGKDMLGHARRHSAVSCAKVAERIDLPFALWTRMGRRKHKFNRIRHVAPMFPHGKAHSRHLDRPSAAAMRIYVNLLCFLLAK